MKLRMTTTATSTAAFYNLQFKMMQKKKPHQFAREKKPMKLRMAKKAMSNTNWSLQRSIRQPLATTTGCTEAHSWLTCPGWCT